MFVTVYFVFFKLSYLVHAVERRNCVAAKVFISVVSLTFAHIYVGGNYSTKFTIIFSMVPP